MKNGMIDRASKSYLTLTAVAVLLLLGSANFAAAQRAPTLLRRTNDDATGRDRGQKNPPVQPLADQFFAGDGSALSALKWGPDGGPYTSAFVAGSVANFNIAGGTGTGGTISVGGINVLQNFTITAASGTLGATAGVINPITISPGVTGDFSTQAWSSSATVGFSLNGGGILGIAGGTYGGGFVLNSGTVVARGVNAMGSGATNTLTINGGTIAGSATRDFTGKYASGITVNSDFQLGALSTNVAISSSTANLTFSNNMALGAATRTITVGANGTYTLGGIISGAAGTGLTVNAIAGATGNLALTNAANTYSGGTTLNGGTLSISADGNIGGASSAITFNGGTLRITGATLTDFGTHVVNYSTFNGGLDINTAATTFTVSQNLLGSGALTKLGAGTLALTGANTYSGATTIGAGTLQLGNGGATGSLSAGSAIIDNGVFKLNRNNVVTQGTDFSGAAITGTGSLLQAGTGTVILNVANTYSGGTTISGTGLLANERSHAPSGSNPEILATANGALGTGNVSLTASGVRLTLQGAHNDFISDNATLSIVTGAIAALNQTGGSDTIGGLILGGVAQVAQGTYGSSASGAMFQFDNFFTGAGTLTLIPEPSTWVMTIMGASLLLSVQRFRRKKS